MSIKCGLAVATDADPTDDPPSAGRTIAPLLEPTIPAGIH